MKYAVLVYQGGLANVFRVASLNMSAFGRRAKRLLQGDFRSCEAFASGLAAAGVKVATAACNEAGDVSDAQWTLDLDVQPFCDKFCPVWNRVDVKNSSIGADPYLEEIPAAALTP